MTAAQQTKPLPIVIPGLAREFFFACGCLDEKCDRAGFLTDALPHVVAAELRAMAGELMARHDMNRRMSVDDAALVLLARAGELDGEKS